jgi:hypothetical protein
MTAPTPTPNAMPANAAPPAAVAPPAPPAPAAPAAAAPAVTPPVDPAAAPPAAPAATEVPPWGDDKDFDPKTAWNLIQNLRGDKTGLQTKLTGLQPVIDAAEQARRDEQGALASAQEDLGALSGDRDAWRAHAVVSDAKAKAAARFEDVDAALALAKIGDGAEFVSGNVIDDAKIEAALEAVAQKHPLLLKPGSPPPPPGFTPNRGQGQPGAGAVSIDAQIDAARKSGNVALSVALQQQKFAQT